MYTLFTHQYLWNKFKWNFYLWGYQRMVFIWGNQLHWMIYEKASQCRVQLSRWTLQNAVHAAVWRLRQCLGTDGRHFQHLHWIQNSRTSLVTILLLYKYSSYGYRVIFFMSKCAYIFLGHSVYWITKGCTSHVGKGRWPEDAPGPQAVCPWCNVTSHIYRNIVKVRWILKETTSLVRNTE